MRKIASTGRRRDLLFCANGEHLIRHSQKLVPPSPRGKALDSRGRIAKAGKFCKQNVACPYKKESKNLTATHIIHCVANKRLALWVIPHKSGEMSAMQTKGTARPQLPSETGERAIKREAKRLPYNCSAFYNRRGDLWSPAKERFLPKERTIRESPLREGGGICCFVQMASTSSVTRKSSCHLPHRGRLFGQSRTHS